jgi:general secretion pathway protein I
MSREPTVIASKLGLTQKGFGLLESIVALTILASTGMALFAWINQNLETASRLKQRDQEARLQLSALELIENINPMSRSEGKVEQPQLEWSAELIEPVRSNTTFLWGVAGPWKLGLYRMKVKVRDETQGLALQFTQLKVGTQRTAVNAIPP